jgi:hypothetical protein
MFEYGSKNCFMYTLKISMFDGCCSDGPLLILAPCAPDGELGSTIFFRGNAIGKDDANFCENWTNSQNMPVVKDTFIKPKNAQLD